MNQGARGSRKSGWFFPFAGIFCLLAFLSYLTVVPLLKPLAWAVILAFISYPLYKLLHTDILKGRFPNVASAFVTVFIVLLLVIPAIFAGSAAAREAIAFIGSYSEMFGAVGSSRMFGLERFLPPEYLDEAARLLDEYPAIRGGITQSVSWLKSYGMEKARAFLGNSISLVYSLVVIFVAYYFLIRDGHLILDYLRDILPLDRKGQAAFMQRANNVLRAVVYGVILTAAVQACLGGFGWWFVGLPNPVLFGALMGMFAMIPFLGTPIVWAPGALYLLLAGDGTNALLLGAWGLCVVSLVDNIIRPYFISENAGMSILLVFLGVFGGLAVWGFLGLFLGPLLLNLFIFFLDGYREIWNAHLRDSVEYPMDIVDSDSRSCPVNEPAGRT
jgi:predicted PurR-regulated permease PerM